MDTGLIVPHMGAYCLSYESHKCLCAYLTMQEFTKEEFLEREIDYIGAGDGQFFRGLCYLSIYTNLGIDDFGKWAEISEAAVTVLGEVCGHPFSSDAEKALYAYGLAVQTFPFDQKHSQFQIDEALCEELLKLEPEKPEALWAMYLTLTAFLDKMEFCQKEQRRVSLFIRALKKMLSVKEAYQALKTIVPESFRYLFASVRKMAEEGCRDILCNYAFEPRYTREDARALYSELKRLAEYLIREKPEVWVSILSETIGEEAPNDHNWCGGTGAMIAFAPDGEAYPCIRYAPISIGEEKAAPMVLGDAERGLYGTEGQRAKKAELDAITRTSQSPETCLVCPVASGCGWCSGYNYECFGTPNRRATNICLAHKARVLAVCYYLNRRSLVLGDCGPKKIDLPRKEAEELIGKEQAEEVFELEKNALAKDGKLCSTVENG